MKRVIQQSLCYSEVLSLPDAAAGSFMNMPKVLLFKTLSAGPTLWLFAAGR
jgi:hypothetical protein